MITPKLPCKLIGIAGHAGVGKDTVANYITVTNPKAVSVAFAAQLKRLCAKLFTLDLDDFYSRVRKETVIQELGVSPRQIAQFVGTELIRKGLVNLIGEEKAKNFWIQKLYEFIKNVHSTKGFQPNTFVVSDVRFQNEYDWILEQGGTVINVLRPGCEGNVGIPEHESEAGIIFNRGDQIYTVINDGTFENLYKQVAQILAHIESSQTSLF